VSVSIPKDVEEATAMAILGTGYLIEHAPERLKIMWQPIETAPWNKKVLLFYRNAAGKGRTITGCYYTVGMLETLDGDSAEEGWYEESETHEEILRTDCQPTHWMALPDPPE
jgi:hypothetical protein